MVVIHQGDIKTVVAHLDGIKHFLAIEASDRAINDTTTVVNSGDHVPRIRWGRNDGALGGCQSGEGSRHDFQGMWTSRSVERTISQKGQERKPLAQIALWQQSDQSQGVSLGDGGGTSAPVEAL